MIHERGDLWGSRRWHWIKYQMQGHRVTMRHSISSHHHLLLLWGISKRPCLCVLRWCDIWKILTSFPLGKLDSLNSHLEKGISKFPPTFWQFQSAAPCTHLAVPLKMYWVHQTSHCSIMAAHPCVQIVIEHLKFQPCGNHRLMSFLSVQSDTAEPRDNGNWPRAPKLLNLVAHVEKAAIIQRHVRLLQLAILTLASCS